jgi:DnaJ-domain-containing protein 1
MGLGKRILDAARSNLNALLEKAAEQGDPKRKLSGVSDEELEAELTRRKAARDERRRVEEARARVDSGSGTGEKPGSGSGSGSGSTGSDREARERAAREREARVKAARAKREQEEPRRAPPPRGAAPPPPRASKVDPVLKGHYETLELAYGATFEEVKTAYRRLMRKYHPDMHTGDPKKHRAATEVAQALTVAYNELEKVLLGGPNRK